MPVQSHILISWSSLSTLLHHFILNTFCRSSKVASLCVAQSLPLSVAVCIRSQISFPIELAGLARGCAPSGGCRSDQFCLPFMSDRLPLASDAASELQHILSPFPAHCLGWFCLGYHLSDVLGRDSCIACLLQQSHVAPAELCTAAMVRPVLARILASHPGWITARPQSLATVTVISSEAQAQVCMASCVQEWTPVAVQECCGTSPKRWKVLPATFFTLARGSCSCYNWHVECS